MDFETKAWRSSNSIAGCSTRSLHAVHEVIIQTLRQPPHEGDPQCVCDKKLEYIFKIERERKIAVEKSAGLLPLFFAPSLLVKEGLVNLIDYDIHHSLFKVYNSRKS